MSVMCGVCDVQIARYKCLSCQFHQYVSVIGFLELDRLKPQSCSIECYKSHRSTHADVPSPAAIQSTPNGLPPKPPTAVEFTGASNSHVNGNGPSFGTYSPSVLESSADLQILYTRYPQLRDQLKEIYKAAIKPPDDELDDQTLSNERRDRGHGRGRNRAPVRDGRTAATWSRHKGIKSGIHRLRMLRNVKGEDGDGLREFSKIVTNPFSKSRQP